jgi:hypothetical protein
MDPCLSCRRIHPQRGDFISETGVCLYCRHMAPLPTEWAAAMLAHKQGRRPIRPKPVNNHPATRCICGASVRPTSMPGHMRSVRHLDNIAGNRLPTQECGLCGADVRDTPGATRQHVRSRRHLQHIVDVAGLLESMVIDGPVEETT